MASCSEYLNDGSAVGKLHSVGTVPSGFWSIERREGATFSIRMINPTFQNGTSPSGGVFRSFSFHECGVNDNDTDNESGFLRQERILPQLLIYRIPLQGLRRNKEPGHPRKPDANVYEFKMNPPPVAWTTARYAAVCFRQRRAGGHRLGGGLSRSGA